MTQDTRPALLVGLTGGIGSGKTTVANLFGELGVPLIDTDLIAHELTAPGGAAMPAIAAEFGPAVVATDGSLDRAAMRRLAFDDPGARRRLEAILHPMIRAQTQRGIAQAATAPYAIVVVPLLVEGGTWRGWLDRVIVVDCPVAVQIERVMRRSALPRDQVEAIIAAQATREQRLAAADEVVDNAGDPASLPQRVREIHERFLKLAAERSPRG
jgi:dephospho-CoA kinase